jgi:hypothetical protein
MNKARILLSLLNGFTLDEALREELRIEVSPKKKAEIEVAIAESAKASAVETVQAPAQAPVAAQATAPAVPATEEWRDLEEDEEIKEGDQWILKPEYRHSRGKVREWRDVEDSIGDLVEDHSKSNFRRRI